MTDDEFLHTFRRSSYAIPLRDILTRRLEKARDDALDAPVTPESLAAVKAEQAIIAAIFGDSSHV